MAIFKNGFLVVVLSISLGWNWLSCLAEHADLHPSKTVTVHVQHEQATEDYILNDSITAQKQTNNLYDYTNDILDESSNIKSVDLDLLSPLSLAGPCQKFVEKFSQATSSFSGCAVLFARPFKFCQNCIDEYMMVKNLYDSLKHEVRIVNSSNSHSFQF